MCARKDHPETDKKVKSLRDEIARLESVKQVREADAVRASWFGIENVLPMKARCSLTWKLQAGRQEPGS